jgi:hypothetical protein
MEMFTMQKSTVQIVEQLRTQRAARKEMRQIRAALNEQAGTKFKEAFMDVFRALRLAAMDISNALRLTIGIIFSFDPEKVKQKIEAFDTRRQKINAEWAPIKQRAMEAFDNADPILTMALMGPANFIAMQGIGAGLVAGKTAAEILAAKNWNELINSFTVTLDTDQSLQQFFQKYSANEERRQEREIEIARGPLGVRTLSRLSNVFSENYEPDGLRLDEQADTKAAQQFSEEQAIDIFVKATGMDKSFEKIRKENLKNLSDTIVSIMADIAPMRDSAMLFAANNLESLRKAFEAAKSKNPKINIADFNKFENTINKETEKLSKDPNFAKELVKQADSEVAELTPEQIAAAAKEKVFRVSKEQLDKQLATGLKNAVSACEVAIKNMGIDNKVLKAMKDSQYSDAKEVAKVYEEMLSTYKEIKDDFENKAKQKTTR